MFIGLRQTALALMNAEPSVQVEEGLAGV